MKLINKTVNYSTWVELYETTATLGQNCNATTTLPRRLWKADLPHFVVCVSSLRKLTQFAYVRT